MDSSPIETVVCIVSFLISKIHHVAPTWQANRIRGVIQFFPSPQLSDQIWLMEPLPASIGNNPKLRHANELHDLIKYLKANPWAGD